MTSKPIWIGVLALGALLLIANRHTLTDDDPRMSAEALLAALDGPAAPLLLDVRSREEYRAGHIPGAVHVEYSLLPRVADRLRPEADVPVVVYCETGVRSRIARASLRAAGYTGIYQLRGDMRDWRAQRRPTARVSGPGAPPRPGAGA